MSKTFQKHFDMILDKLKSGEHFGYCRFSDGELRIMQNVELKLAADHFKIGDKKNGGSYAAEDHKHFDPKEHQFFREKLMESYRFKKDNYFVGLSCRCCVGDKDFKQMLEMYDGDTSSDNLTWANLFLNGNYPQFVDKFIPEFKNKKIVYIVNENADLSGLPFKVLKDFRVGENCIINDYGLINKVKKWISDNNIEDHVFLFSASSLSNFMVHQLFKHNNNNTYIDIGTTLNPYIGMKARRGYHVGNKKICIW
ncbi:MAG: hypothetical protein ACW98X_23135 [Promethearchaeota archaeon]|jgi:hypothetical protein